MARWAGSIPGGGVKRERRKADQQVAAVLDEMDAAGINPAIDGPRSDAGNLRGVLRGDHLHLAAAVGTPHGIEAMASAGAYVDAFLGLNGHFRGPDGSFLPQAVSPIRKGREELGLAPIATPGVWL
jgi:hypothetical protein